MNEIVPATEDTAATIPMTTPAVPVEAAPPVEFSSIVPEAYKNEAWINDVPDVETFFKMTSDMKSKMGERQIPGAESTPEQWAEFNKGFGVPDTPEGFNLGEPVEGQEGFQSAMRDMFHKAGCNQRQVDELVKGYNEFASKTGDTATQDTDFDKLAQDTFGADTEAILETSKKYLQEYTSDSHTDLINGLSNENLIVMADFVHNFTKAHISEDTLPAGGNAAPSGAMSSSEKIAEGTRLMGLPEYSDRSHPGHAAVFEKAGRLFGTWQE